MKKKMLALGLAFIMSAQMSTPVLVYAHDKMTAITDVNTKLDYFENSDFEIEIKLKNGDTITNNNEEVLNYVELVAATNDNSQTAYFIVKNPDGLDETSKISDITFSYYEGALDKKTNQRIFIEDACNVYFDGIYFERQATYSSPSLTFSAEATGSTLNFIGDNTFKVYSYGEYGDGCNTIVGLENVNSISNGDGTTNIFLQEEHHEDGKYFQGISGIDVKYLENSREFGVTVAGATGASGLGGIYAKTSSGYDGQNNGVVEDFLTEDVEYDPTTKTFTFKSDYRYTLRYSTYVNKVVVAENAGTPQILHTTATNATYVRNSNSSFFELYSDIEIILGAKVSYGYNTLLSDVESLSIPTFLAPNATESQPIDVSIRGYNGYTYASKGVVMNVYTSANLSDSINVFVADGHDEKLLVIHPVALALGDNPLSVINLSDDTLKIATKVDKTNDYDELTNTWAWDVCYASNVLYINTDSKLSISGSSSTASIRVLDTLDGTADLVFDNLSLTQTSGKNMLLIENDTKIELVGTNTISTSRNLTSVRPLYLKSGDFSLSGSGDFNVYSTYGTYNSTQGIANGSDNDKITDQVLADAITNGGATGDINHYNLLNYPSGVAISVSGGENNLITSDKFSYDNDFYITVLTSEDVTIAGSAYFGLKIDTQDDKEVNVNFNNTDMYQKEGNASPFFIVNTPVNINMNTGRYLALIGEDSEDIDDFLLELYSSLNFGGNGDIYIIANAGVVPVGSRDLAEEPQINIGENLTAGSDVKFWPYTYTGHTAVKQSGFSITAVGVEVKPDIFIQVSTMPISEPFENEEDFSFVSSEQFYGTGSSENKDLLVINTDEMMIIETASPTTDLLAVNKGVEKSVEIVLKGVNINVSADDPNLPLMYIGSNTNLYLFSGFANWFTVKYDAQNPSTMPTISVEDDAELTIYELGGTFSVNSRYGAEAIGGSMVNPEGNDDFTDVMINKLKIVSNDSTKTLDPEKDYEFDMATSTLIIKTNTPVKVSSVNQNALTNMSIIISSEIEGTATVTIEDLNIYRTMTTAILLDIQNDTNLIISGNNTLTPEIKTTGLINTTPVVNVANGVTLNIYGTDASVLNLTTARVGGAGIDVQSTAKLNIYGGTIKGNSGTYQGSVIGTNRLGYAHGDISIYGGIFEFTAGSGGRGLGNQNAEESNIAIYGGEFHLNSTTIGNSNTNLSFGDEDNGGSAVIYYHDSNYSSTVAEATSFIYHGNSSKDDWNVMVVSVPSSYSQTDANRKGYYCVFGNFILTNENINIGKNEELRFYVAKLSQSFLGFEDGMRPDDGVNYAMLTTNRQNVFYNDGTIYRNAYLYQNPHISHNFQGDGTIEVKITTYLMSIVENDTGVSNGYRGNSLFNYFDIKENDVDIVDIDKLSLKLYYINDENQEVLQSGYVIPQMGSYVIKIETNESKVNAVTEQEEHVNLVFNETTYTKSDQENGSDDATDVLAFKELTIGATNLTSAQGGYEIANDVFVYRGKENPYTAKELTENVVFTFDNRIMDKTGTSTNSLYPEYIAKVVDENTAYSDDYKFENAKEDISLIASSAKNEGVEAKYYFGETSPNYYGYLGSQISIESRSLRDPNVVLTFNDGVLFSQATNMQEPDIKYYYTNSENKSVFDELSKDVDFTIEYAQNGNVISNTADFTIGIVTATVTGKGNFTGEISFDYELQLSFKEDSMVEISPTLKNPITGEVDSTVENNTSIEVGLAGRPSATDIVVKYDNKELVYLVDYILDYEINEDKIKIKATGIGDYCEVYVSDEIPYFVNADINPLDESAIFFKPDNTLDLSLIEVTTGTEQTKLTLKTDYDIEITYNEVNPQVVDIKITVNMTGLLAGSKYEYYQFELQPMPAGSGTDDFAHGAIHLTQTVYERPDGLFYFEDDLLIITSPDNDGNYKTLEKDTDYKITSSNDQDDVLYGTVTIEAIAGSGYEGEVTFDYTKGRAGTGTGNNVFFGIIDIVGEVAIPGNAETLTGEEAIKAQITKEVSENIVLKIDDYTLTYGQHYEVLEVTDFIFNDGNLVSNAVKVNILGKGQLEGQTKEFNIILVSSTTLIDTENFYIAPDYTIDLSTIKVLHPVSGQNLLSSEYTIEEFWYKIDGVMMFVAVDVTYSQDFIDTLREEYVDNALAIDFYERLGSDNTIQFQATPKSAGTGTHISYGLINHLEEEIYYRPDGKLYNEDVIIKAGTGSTPDLFIGEDYSILDIYLSDKWNPTNKGVGEIPDSMSHNMIIQGLKNDGRLNGQLSFYVNVLKAGSNSTGTDISKGVLDEISSIYLRPDGLLYFEEDLHLTSGGEVFSDANYNIVKHSETEYTVLLEGKNGYTGEISFGFKVDPAGSNSSGSKDVSEGIIYQVSSVKEDINGQINLGEDLLIQANSGIEGDASKVTLTYQKDYDLSYVKVSDTEIRVTLTGMSQYSGEVTFRVFVEQYNPLATYVSTVEFVTPIIYQRPDGLYYMEDLEIYIKETDADTREEVITKLYETTDYILSYEDETFTLYGRGNYIGITEIDVSMREAGTGLGYNVFEGIIYKVNPVEKYESDVFDLNDVELYVSFENALKVDGEDFEVIDGKVKLDPYFYEISQADYYAKENVVKVTVKGINGYTSETTFVVEINNIKKPSSSATVTPPTTILPEEPEVEEEANPEEGSTNDFENPFVDVSPNDWYYDDLVDLYLEDVIKGTTSSTFSPFLGTSRAEIVEILYRLEGSPAVIPNSIFTDVSNNAWYAKSVTWATNNDIVLGIGNDLFAPDLTITREQVATMLVRYMNYLKQDVMQKADLSNYVDAFEISNFAVEGMMWAVENEILKGTTETTLKPKDTTTRAEIVTIINRLKKLILLQNNTID